MSTQIRQNIVTSFVFQPGGTQTQNAYTSWSALIAAVNALENINTAKTIYFDSSLAATSIPAGAWNFGAGTVLEGTDGATLTIDDGVTFTTPPFVIRGLTIASNATAPVCVYDGTVSPYLLLELTTISCTANPMFQITDFAQIVHDEFSVITNSGGSEVYDVVSPGQCFLVLFTGGSIESNTVQSNVGATVVIYYPNGQGVAAQAGFATTQTNSLGTMNYSGDLPLEIGGRVWIVDSVFGDDGRGKLGVFPFETIEAVIADIASIGAAQDKIYLAPGQHDIAAAITLPTGSKWTGVSRDIVSITRTGNPAAGEATITMSANSSMENISINIESTSTDAYSALVMPNTAGGSDNQLRQVTITADNTAAGAGGSTNLNAVQVTSTSQGGDDNIQMEDCRMFVRSSNLGTKRALYLSGAGGKVVSKNGFYFVNAGLAGSTGTAIETVGASTKMTAYQGGISGTGAGTLNAYVEGAGSTIQLNDLKNSLVGDGVATFRNIAVDLPDSSATSSPNQMYVDGTVLSLTATGNQGWNATALNDVLGNGAVANADAYHSHGGVTGVTVLLGTGLNTGVLVAMDDNAGVPTAYGADANGTAHRRNPVGYLETGGNGGDTRNLIVLGPASVPDAQWDAVPAVTDVGAPVYMSTTIGNSTITPPSGPSDTVIQVGTVFVGDTGVDTCQVLFELSGSNGTASGDVNVTKVSGEAIAIGAPVCIQNSAGNPRLFNTDANSSTRFNGFGINTTTAGASGVSCVVAIAGEVSIPDAIWDSVPAVANAGDLVYLSENVGKLTLTAPVTAGSVVLNMGVVGTGGAGAVTLIIEVGTEIIL